MNEIAAMDDAAADHRDEANGPPFAVETFVERRRGQWAVDLVVCFPEGVIRRTIATYRTARHAEVAAGLIRRAVDRDTNGPRHD